MYTIVYICPNSPQALGAGLAAAAEAQPQDGDEDGDQGDDHVGDQQLGRAVRPGIEDPQHVRQDDGDVHRQRHVARRAPLQNAVGLRQERAHAEDPADAAGDGG